MGNRDRVDPELLHRSDNGEVFPVAWRMVEMTRDTLALWVAFGISVVWGLNFVAGFVLPGYEPEPYVQGAFALAAAYLFYARKSEKNGRGADD